MASLLLSSLASFSSAAVCGFGSRLLLASLLLRSLASFSSAAVCGFGSRLLLASLLLRSLASFSSAAVCGFGSRLLLPHSLARSRFSVRSMASGSASGSSSGSASGSSSESASGSLQKIQIPRDGTTFDGYVTGKENAPGIVVVQEWRGVDFQLKNHALHIAQMNPGYRALIPDLFHGKLVRDNDALILFPALDWKDAVKDIRASVKWLKATGSSKVGVTGYGTGGAMTIASAVLVPEVDVVVSFYGVCEKDVADPASAKAPVQAHFGELDQLVEFSDAAAAKALEEKLKSSGLPHEVYIYLGCGHGFMNASPDGNKRRKEMGMNDEDLAVVDLAWSRFSSWMSHYLLSP